MVNVEWSSFIYLIIFMFKKATITTTSNFNRIKRIIRESCARITHPILKPAKIKY